MADGLLTVENLPALLSGYLQETGAAESYFCAIAYRLAAVTDSEEFVCSWLALNQRLSAFRPAAESRLASAAMGRRFLTLASRLSADPRLALAYGAAQSASVEPHYVTALGLTAGLLGLGEQATLLAFLQQSLMSLLAASQKLLPVGQSLVADLLWRCKPDLLVAAERGAAMDWSDGTVTSTAPLLELAALRHRRLAVRLFIS